MRSLHDALRRVLSAVQPVLPERVGLDQAFGRVLAQDVVSPLDVPPWDNSAMDGFAVRRADVTQPGVVLRVGETIPAGSVPSVALTPGVCARIMTGAPIPQGADAVVMVERTAEVGPDRVRVDVVPTERQHIRPQGGDVTVGAVVLSAGAVLTPAAVGTLASLGMPSVLVAQRPRVALLGTGDEVVEPGWPVAPGQIYSSNTLSLMGLVLEAGGVPVHCGIAPDTPDGLRAALARCGRADVIVTTGGVSVGDYDHVKDVLGELDFWKVAMKPGKPLAFGRFNGVPVFGLPGNPVSCMVNFLQFVRPVIRATLGDPSPYLPVVDAVLDAPVRKKPGRALLARVTLRWDQGRWVATPARSQSSGVLSSMMHGTGLTLIPPDAGSLAAGERVRVQVYRAQGSPEPDLGWSDHAPLHDHGC